MHYQNLNVIHKPSKKLLTMKSVKSFLLTPSTYLQSKSLGKSEFEHGWLFKIWCEVAR